MNYFDRPDYKLRTFANNPRWLRLHITVSHAEAIRYRSEEDIQHMTELEMRQRIARAVADEVVTKGLVKIEHDMEGMHVRFSGLFLTYDELMNALHAAYSAGRLDMPQLKVTP